MSTDLATKASSKSTLRQWLESNQMKNAIAQSLPKHITPDRFVRVALNTLTRTPKLAECDQASFFQSILTLSQLGLEADGRRAHLIPFWNSKRNVFECQLIIDYKGLVELVMRSGNVSFIHADLICEKDEFHYNMGEIVRHVVNFREPRGEPFAVYSLCKFKDGSQKCEVMSMIEVDAIRARSKTPDKGPWKSDFGEMAKKTVFRRLSKWLPFSSEIHEAMASDDDKISSENLIGQIQTTAKNIGESKADEIAALLQGSGSDDGDESNQSHEAEVVKEAVPAKTSTKKKPEKAAEKEDEEQSFVEDAPSDSEVVKAFEADIAGVSMVSHCIDLKKKINGAAESGVLSTDGHVHLLAALDKRKAELTAKPAS